MGKSNLIIFKIHIITFLPCQETVIMGAETGADLDTIDPDLKIGTVTDVGIGAAAMTAEATIKSWLLKIPDLGVGTDLGRRGELKEGKRGSRNLEIQDLAIRERAIQINNSNNNGKVNSHLAQPPVAAPIFKKTEPTTFSSLEL